MLRPDALIVLKFYADQIRKGSVVGIFADFYEDDLFADAINTLVPNFEYPDWSHLTIAEALEKING